MSQANKLIDLVSREILRFDGVSSCQSVKVNEEDELYVVNTDIRVYYGVNIPQLCYDIQTGLIKRAEDIGGFNVTTINIRVEGIDEE